MSIELPQSPTITDSNFGTFASPGHDNFCSTLEPTERLNTLGWLQACPNPPAIAEEFGKDWTIARYLESNFVGALIIERAQILSPYLAKKLSTSITRLIDEPAKGFDPNFIPETHLDSMSPASTPWGYGAPRALIEQFGREKPWKIGDERVMKGIKILNEAIKQSYDPSEFLAILADKITQADADPTAVLSHILAIELKNEGSFTLIKLVAEQIEKKSPELWQHYLSLTPEDTEAAGIIAKSDLVTSTE